MRALTPERGLVNLRSQMDRLFERFWEPDVLELPMIGDWAPKLDMIENKTEILIRAEVAGIEPKGVEAPGTVIPIKTE